MVDNVFVLLVLLQHDQYSFIVKYRATSTARTCNIARFLQFGLESFFKLLSRFDKGHRVTTVPA